MAWPTNPVNTANLDSVLDAPYDARPDLLDMATKVNAIMGERANIADAVHGHAISDVTGLQTAIDAKQASSPRLTAIAAANGVGILTKTGGNAYSIDTTAYQPLDATLTAVAGATTGVDKLHYWTGADTLGVATLTSAARSVLDDANVSAMRDTLGLTIGTNVQAWDIRLDKVSNNTYPGSPSIIQVGYVISGAWQANPIDVLYGGTGTGAGLTGYVKGNGISAMSATTTIPDADVAGVQQTLTDGATIAWNIANGRNAVVTIQATGRTITPSNIPTGRICVLKVIQGTGGSKTITTWNNVKWNAGSAPTLTTTAARWDVFVFYSDGTNLLEIGRNLNQS